MSRFTRASSGGKAGGSHGDSEQTATAVEGPDKHGGAAAAGSGEQCAEAGELEGTEVLEVDPAQLDRPEGAIVADAPDPEDADLRAATLVRSSQEATALTLAARAEPPGASVRPAQENASANLAETATAPEQARVHPADEQPAQADGEEASGKHSQAIIMKRRKTASNAGGRRVTRARAAAVERAVDLTEATAPTRSRRARPSSRPRRTAADPGTGAAGQDGEAQQKDSSPAASSDCVLLGEAHESAHCNDEGSSMDAPPPDGQQQKMSGSADMARCQNREVDAAQETAQPVSDSEHSSAMAVEPRFSGDEDVDSGGQAAMPSGGDGSSDPMVPDPAAVRQVRHAALFFQRQKIHATLERVCVGIRGCGCS